MRPTRSFIIAVLTLVLAINFSLAQPPDRESRGGRRGRGGYNPDGSGDRGPGRRGSNPDSSGDRGPGRRSYNPDGGGDRGPGGWGGRGGPSKSSDPNGFFDRVSGGKDVWKKSESDPKYHSLFDRIAEQLGVTNGEITRQQFVDYMQNKLTQRGMAPAGPSPAGTSDPNADPYAKFAEASFRALDKNGDGRLDYNEMPPDLQAELSKWDTNNNGTIELDEYKRYYAAKRQQRTADLSEMRASYGAGAPVVTPAMSRTAPGKAEPQKPLVYTKNNLPKEMPSWFRQLADDDAQIAFYQWKAAGRSLNEFRQYDLNNDGFITVPEVLAYQAAQTKKSATGKPSFHIAQGGETTAGNLAGSPPGLSPNVSRTSPGSPPTVIRIDRTNIPPSPGNPNVPRFDPSRFRNRGDRSGGSPQTP
jgi:Ca2+-binding EF-hand superfamily protein